MSAKAKTVCMILMGELTYDGRVRKEALSLVKHGYRVTVITMPKAREKLDGLEPVRVKQTLLVGRRLMRQSSGLAFKYGEFVARAAARAIAQPASVYHAHDLPALLPAYIAAKVKGARLVYDAHELWTEQGTSYSDRNVWRRPERWLLRRVDGVVTVNDSRAKIIHEEYGSPVAPVVVRNCPPFSQALPSDSQPLRQFAATHGQRGARVVLYQGGIAPDRCYETLIDAVPSLRNGVVVVLLGYGNEGYVAQLKARVQEKGLQSKVLFHAAVPNAQILEYTASADLGVVFYDDNCRNNRYCAPNKLYDYMMAGIPSVASDLPGIQEVVQREDVGVLVNSKDHRSIATGINRLLDDPDHYQVQRQKALRLAQEQFNWERQEHELLGLYERLLKAA
ncbi:MAG: glycosyltransferase family 4 protein [Chloroflexi bacterium]|nr:glycosyltransferase family 4 protein [Chloroflexota bacterium]